VQRLTAMICCTATPVFPVVKRLMENHFETQRNGSNTSL
jgi:hypothetical protein